MKPRFFLDEHMDPAIQRQLRRLNLEIEINRIGEPGVPSAGTPDPEILDWLEQNNYLLVTGNRRTMPVHLADHLNSGKHIPGILLLRGAISLGELVEDLLLIWYASEVEEYTDKISFIPF